MENFRIENPAKYHDKMLKVREKCPRCRHTVKMPVFVDSKICNYCGTRVFNKRREFKTILKNKLKQKEGEK